MIAKHTKVCRFLNYFEHFFLFISAVASLVGISVGITCSAGGLKTCAITAGIKRYKSIIKKK